MASKENYWKNPEKAREQSLKSYRSHRKSRLTKMKEYAETHQDEIKLRMRQYREENKRTLQKEQRVYYLNNREQRLAYSKEWRNSNPTYNLTRRLRRYGLTLEQYSSLLAQQGGGCAICGNKESKLLIDHDHDCCPGHKSCGKCVRGLLCASCNHALGQFKDDAERMINAAKYLVNSRLPYSLLGAADAKQSPTKTSD